MLIEHSDRCAICGAAPWVLCIDHDHQTLALRGLLGGPCNTKLGHVERLQRERRLGRLRDRAFLADAEGYLGRAA